MTQAVTLKFHPVTNTKPDRWTAKASAGSLTVCQDAIFNAVDGSVERAKLDGVVCPKGYTLWLYLVSKGWHGHWVISQMHTGDYVAVQVPGTLSRTIKVTLN